MWLDEGDHSTKKKWLFVELVDSTWEKLPVSDYLLKNGVIEGNPNYCRQGNSRSSLPQVVVVVVLVVVAWCFTPSQPLRLYQGVFPHGQSGFALGEISIPIYTRRNQDPGFADFPTISICPYIKTAPYKCL